MDQAFDRGALLLLACLVGLSGCQARRLLAPGSEDSTRGSIPRDKGRTAEAGSPYSLGIKPRVESSEPGGIDLATALARAGVENPTIARAAEVVRVSQAELLGARALLLPTLHAGASVDLHRGNLLSSSGIVRDLHRDSVYVGAGASAVG